jgi:hypothetical protein
LRPRASALAPPIPSIAMTIAMTINHPQRLSMKHRRTRRKSFRALALSVAVAASLVLVPSAVNAATSSTTATSTTTAKPPVYAYYYLWWSSSHWKNKLGSKYPYTASTLPLPATLDASGCNPKSLYAGNQLTDVPAKLYSQDDPGVIEKDVRTAAKAGLSGFAVNWIGSGTANQTVTSTPYSKRLKVLVDAVKKVNAEGIPFKLWLSYKASASVKDISHITNDLGYFARTYGKDSAFEKKGNRVTVIWQGSRKYSSANLASISKTYRGTLRILGDETTWSTSRGAYLDGNAYYWSSQNPYKNPQSFKQLGAQATAVRKSPRNPDGSVKTFVAPLNPGYNKQLAGGTNCVPRNGGATLRDLYKGNLAATNPDAFGLISWNEITEGTYITPMKRYGMQSLDVVKSLVGR